MINLIGPINQLGYGITTLNILKSLCKLTDVSYWPIGQIQPTNQNDVDIILNAIENAKFFNSNAPCLRVWHQYDMAQFVGHGSHIAFPIFELDTFTKQEKHHLKSANEIFVCSKWAKKIIVENGIESDTSVIPLGVDLSIFKPHLSESKNTIFFNCGKWEIRKGHDILIDAFTKAFTPEDNAELWLMTENPFLNEEEKNKWESLYKLNKYYTNGKIRLISRVNTQEEVYNIMKMADCGVFPARAEGWNLEALEMLACGKQIIITYYSAHTEFCNSSNSHIIPIQEKELAYDNKWFFGQGSWGKIDDSHVELISNKMKSVHENKQSGNFKLNENGIETAKKFTWDNTAERILDAIYT
jgi:glycosyltransferase involved in cell wall biosynthesis